MVLMRPFAVPTPNSVLGCFELALRFSYSWQADRTLRLNSKRLQARSIPALCSDTDDASPSIWQYNNRHLTIGVYLAVSTSPNLTCVVSAKLNPRMVTEGFLVVGGTTNLGHPVFLSVLKLRTKEKGPRTGCGAYRLLELFRLKGKLLGRDVTLHPCRSQGDSSHHTGIC